MNYMHYCYNCCMQGPPGVQGPQGIQGPPGPGVAPAWFNAVSVGGSQDLALDENVIFLLSQQTPGDFTFTDGSDIITINTPGTYKIDYEVTLRGTDGTINSAYAIVVNGAEHPFSLFGMHHNGSSSGRFGYTGFLIVQSVTAGTTIQLRHKSSTLDRLDGTGIDGQDINRAAILIQRVS